MKENDEQEDIHKTKKNSKTNYNPMINQNERKNFFNSIFKKTAQTSNKYYFALEELSKQIKNIDNKFSKSSSMLGLENTSSNLNDIEYAVLSAQQKAFELQKNSSSINVNNIDEKDFSNLENSDSFETFKYFEFYPNYIDYKKYIPKCNTYLPIQEALKNELGSNLLETLYNQTHETMKVEKINNYTTKKEKIKSEKNIFWGLFSRKNKIKNMKLQNLDLQIRIAENSFSPIPESYNMADILCDLKLYKEEQNIANFSPKMQKFYDGIHEFGSKEIIEAAEIKFESCHCNLAPPLVNISGFSGNQKQLELLQKRNLQLHEILNHNSIPKSISTSNFESAHDSLLSHLKDLGAMLSNKLYDLEHIKTNFIQNEKISNFKNEPDFLEV